MPLTSEGHGSTVAVRANAGGQRYFVFECTRYAIREDGTFGKLEAKFGASHAQVSVTTRASHPASL